jgi:hypothetical protein
MGLLEKHPGRNIGDIKDNLSVELSDYVYLPRKPFTNSSGNGLRWQRVRGSNPYFNLERALIYLRNTLITRCLRIKMFPVALLLLNSKSLSKRFVDSIRTVRAQIVSG